MKVVNYVREHQKLVIYLVINLVPRVLSYPPTRHSLRGGGGGGGGGGVGENPGNELTLSSFPGSNANLEMIP